MRWISAVRCWECSPWRSPPRYGRRRPSGLRSASCRSSGSIAMRSPSLRRESPSPRLRSPSTARASRRTTASTSPRPWSWTRTRRHRPRPNGCCRRTATITSACWTCDRSPARGLNATSFASSTSFRSASDGLRPARRRASSSGQARATTWRPHFASATGKWSASTSIGDPRDRCGPSPEHLRSRVTRADDDARVFRTPEGLAQFDIVCYGLLDSHAMFSSMSSLRLDRCDIHHEGLRDAWAHVADNGVLSVSFSVASEWMYQRLLALVRNATGVEPIVVQHGYDCGVTFLAGRRSLSRMCKRCIRRRRRAKRTCPRSACDRRLAVPLPASGNGAVDVHRSLPSDRGHRRHRAAGMFGSLFSRGGSIHESSCWALPSCWRRAPSQPSLLFGSTWVMNTTYS